MYNRFIRPQIVSKWRLANISKSFYGLRSNHGNFMVSSKVWNCGFKKIFLETILYSPFRAVPSNWILPQQFCKISIEIALVRTMDKINNMVACGIKSKGFIASKWYIYYDSDFHAIMRLPKSLFTSSFGLYGCPSVQCFKQLDHHYYIAPMFIGYDKTIATLWMYVPLFLTQYSMKYVYLTSSINKDGWKNYFESLI